MLMFGEAMSIFARSTREPSGNSPFFMRRKRSQILLGRTVAIGGIFAWLGQRAAVFADFLLGEVVHIRQPAADEVERKFINLVVLLGGIVDVGIN